MDRTEQRTRALEDQIVDVTPGREVGTPIRVEPWPRWVRAYFNNQAVVDSKRVMLMLEPARLPVFYFPRQDVRMDLLKASGRTEDSPRKGQATLFDLTVGERTAKDAAWSYERPPEEIAAATGHVAFYWDRLDRWLEEDDEVFVHPRNPYHRVDVLNSSRHVRIELGGVTVAETRRPRLLFETGLPTRYYFPKVDVRMDLLEPTELRTRCPYKGQAVYWTATVEGQLYPEIAWSYPSPIPECPKIEGLLCFFNERVDISVDGELQDKPKTFWSSWG